MGRFTGWMRAVGARRAALFAVITAAVAVGFYVGLREAEISPRSEALGETQAEQAAALPQQGEDDTKSVDGGEPDADALSLRLSAPTICIVYHASREVHASYRTNDDGEEEEVHRFGDWTSVETVSVAWEVSGGTPPYSLVIDDEPGDPQGEYDGASGSAEVSCALEIGDTYSSDRWGERQRWHRSEPTLDSGLKTIEAVVTDGTGATANATIEVYAVRRIEASDELLERGKTYLVFGTLFTIPDEYDMETGATAEPENGPAELLVTIYEEGVDPHALIVINLDTGEEIGRCVLVGGSLLSGSGSCADPTDPSVDPSIRSLHAALGEFSASSGRAPVVDRP